MTYLLVHISLEVTVAFTDWNDVYGHFKNLLDQLPPLFENFGVLTRDDVSFLARDVPLGPAGGVDMLLADLPPTFPNYERADNVLQNLKNNTHVFAPAVSGSGKVRG